MVARKEGDFPWIWEETSMTNLMHTVTIVVRIAYKARSRSGAVIREFSARHDATVEGDYSLASCLLSFLLASLSVRRLLYSLTRSSITNVISS